MKFQFSTGHLAVLTMLAAGTVTLPAAAEDRAPESPEKSREPQPAEAPPGHATPAAAKDTASDPAGKSRDAKTTSTAVDRKIEELRDGLPTSVQPKEDGPSPEGKGSAPCEGCNVQTPASSSPLMTNQVSPQEMPASALGTRPPLATSEPHGDRQQLGHALGIGGIVAAALGSYLTVGALVTRNSTQAEVVSGLNGFFFAGLAGIGVGAGLMIGGFSLAATPTQSASVERIPIFAQRRNPTDIGASLSGSF